MRLVALLLCFFVSSQALAGALTLQPANPQPTGLKSGLAVEYAFPPDVKTLGQAERDLRRAKPGKPLAGLDYRDTDEGEPTLTSGRAEKVVARITGYVKFDSAGDYIIDFVSNDGVKAIVGGQQVVFFDGRHTCQESAPQRVIVPEAGWYPIEVVYFQRYKTACLHMRAGKDEPDWMPNSAFGYK
ncbi:MAG: PA14 domain-containing protein [Pseudomonadota bacterium]